MKVESKLILTDKELNLINDFKSLIVNICRAFDCDKYCPLNFKNDVCKCGIYEMTNLILYLKDKSFIEINHG